VKIDAHLHKFRRLDAMLTRLDPVADRELWIWTAMNAGVHLLNAALHHAGATDATDSFHTQVEGLYAAPDRDRGTLRDCLHDPGDVMHFGQPPLARPVPEPILRAGEALREIEDLREPFVRGDGVPSAGAEADWLAAYGACTAGLCRELGIAREPA
jgi:hypothetical protein